MDYRQLKQQFLDSGHRRAEDFVLSLPPDRRNRLRCQVPIHDNGESLCPISQDIERYEPHLYQDLGAPYGENTPYVLRASVAPRLMQAQQALEQWRPGYCLKIFDAFRPIAVQAFMIEYESQRLARERGLDRSRLSSDERDAIQQEVQRFWALPDENPSHPPPHSTGAVVDLTVVDSDGQDLPMGTPIDHLGPEAMPNYYRDTQHPDACVFHQNRQRLNEAMTQAGFCRLPHEWWHFSYGDQWWALLAYLDGDLARPHALYGRV